MAAPRALIAAWARSPIAPHGGAFRDLTPHALGAPMLRALLERARVSADAVDAVVIGNALGAGGNPARLVALAAGLPEATPAFTVDTQCCAGLDAVSLAVGLLASGQAQVVIAGGVEAWSRAPIRQHRPLRAGDVPVAYERPAFTPFADRDPDMLVAAAAYAQANGHTRLEQDAYAIRSHALALAGQGAMAAEIVPIAGLAHDAHPRTVTLQRAARMPAATAMPAHSPDCSMSKLAVSPRADGAAFILLATEEACARLGIHARAQWVGSASVGLSPETPMLAAQKAASRVLAQAHMRSDQLGAVELHDAFAVQGLAFCEALSLNVDLLNLRGGGLARGHPIGASGAVALVRVLADLARDGGRPGTGLAAVAGAGGIGAAALVRRCD
ncbi:thiolase family protein [Hydrogenophaga sp. BPS33]|uniref:thiolase family protein n=1 Tax=Hydrogenophaga sp. BPS33 TaxID=2651974 RepID=UPI0013200FD5|nr:thiolase family protein [Hydrogenophaga sp. BPS33]QHE83857.1 thiolase family protein [Hydrogenophaga sp. BPS33]